MWTILKVFTEFTVILFLFYISFGHKTCELLPPWPGIGPAPPALEGKVFTTGIPGQSREGHFGFLFNFLCIWGYSRLTNNVVIFSSEQGRDSAIHIQASILPQTPLPSKLPQNAEQSSVRSMAGPRGLSILNMRRAVRAWPPPLPSSPGPFWITAFHRALHWNMKFQKLRMLSKTAWSALTAFMPHNDGSPNCTGLLRALFCHCLVHQKTVNNGNSDSEWLLFALL